MRIWIVFVSSSSNGWLSYLLTSKPSNFVSYLKSVTSLWTCMSVGRLVGLSLFPKQARSYTSKAPNGAPTQIISQSMTCFSCSTLSGLSCPTHGWPPSGSTSCRPSTGPLLCPSSSPSSSWCSWCWCTPAWAAWGTRADATMQQTATQSGGGGRPAARVRLAKAEGCLPSTMFPFQTLHRPSLKQYRHDNSGDW